MEWRGGTGSFTMISWMANGRNAAAMKVVFDDLTITHGR